MKNQNSRKEFESKLIDKLMKETLKEYATDYIVNIILSNYSKTNHEILGLPGEFLSCEDSEKFKLDNGLKPDSVVRVKLNDFKVMEKIALVINYLSVDIERMVSEFFKFDVLATSKLKLPCINVVLTDNDPGWSEKVFIVDKNPVKISIRLFDEKKIDEIMKELMKRDFHRDFMVEEDLVNFLYCIAFAKKDYAKKYIEKCLELYTGIEKISPAHQMILFEVIKEKIKFYYDSDLKEKENLLIELTKATPYNVLNSIL